MKPFVLKEQIKEQLLTAKLWNEQVEEALSRAILSHRYHIRDDGSPYLEQHVYPMVSRVLQKYTALNDLQDLVVLSLLHDCYEKDPHFDIEEVREFFGDKIANDVIAITEEPRRGLQNLNEQMEQNLIYVQKIKDSSENVKLTKLESWLNNLMTTEILHDLEKYRKLIAKAETLYLPFAKEFYSDYLVEFECEIERLKKLLEQRSNSTTD